MKQDFIEGVGFVRGIKVVWYPIILEKTKEKTKWK